MEQVMKTVVKQRGVNKYKVKECVKEWRCRGIGIYSKNKKGVRKINYEKKKKGGGSENRKKR